MKTIYLTAGTEYVQFDELAHTIATALFPLGESATDGEMMAYGGARINLETELLQAAKSGALPVKDPLTFGPHSYPVGNALRTALVSVNDLRTFLTGRPITIEAAPAQNVATPAPVVAETPELRRARWLDIFTEEERITKRGAKQRVYERELLQNPKADRSFIRKEIEKAKEEKAKAKQGGTMFGQLVQDGKRKR